jgi:hypothetical protein
MNATPTPAAPSVAESLHALREVATSVQLAAHARPVNDADLMALRDALTVAQQSQAAALADALAALDRSLAGLAGREV